MRKIIIISTVFLLMGTTKVLSQYEGTFGMGAHVGYAKEINSMGVGFHFHYFYTNSIRFAPSYTYYVPIKGRNMWEIDMDTHYVIPINWEFSFYPIAGLHYSSWKYESKEYDADSWSKQRPGLNLGAGLQYDLRYKVRTGLEMKYQVMRDFSQLNIMLSIGFWI